MNCSPPGYSVFWFSRFLPDFCLLPTPVFLPDSPGKNTGVDCHALLQVILPNLSLAVPALKVDSLPRNHWGSGIIIGIVKMRSYWSKVNPKSKIVNVLIRSRNFYKTHMQEKCNVKLKVEMGWCSKSQGIPKTARKTSEAKREDWIFSPAAFKVSSLLTSWSRNSRLQNSETVNFCLFWHPVFGILSQQS